MKVKVEYLFSRNDKIGSWLIRKLTKPLAPNINITPSHVSLLVNGRWVHESTLFSGVRVIQYDKWLKKNVELKRILHSNFQDYEEIKNKFKEIKGKNYDWLGVIYLGLSILANIILSIDMPKENKWHSSDKYFCSEIIGYLFGMNYDMHTPVQILRDMLFVEK